MQQPSYLALALPASPTPGPLQPPSVRHHSRCSAYRDSTRQWRRALVGHVGARHDNHVTLTGAILLAALTDYRWSAMIRVQSFGVSAAKQEHTTRGPAELPAPVSGRHDPPTTLPLSSPPC